MHPYAGIIRIRLSGIISALTKWLKAPRASMAAKLSYFIWNINKNAYILLPVFSGKLNKGRPVKRRRVAAIVQPESQIAADNGVVNSRIFCGAQIFFA